MRILVAPCAFKGVASAVEVAAGWAAVLRDQGFSVDICPIADGGDGTLDVLEMAVGGRRFFCEVTGPLGEPVKAYWYLLRDGTGFVESAVAYGMRVLPEGKTGGLAATSHGVGELVCEALQKTSRVIVGVGGTAGTDGGRGALEALGIFPPVSSGQQSISSLAMQTFPNLPFGIAGDRSPHKWDRAVPVLRAVAEAGLEITIACDVWNPLLGPMGAASVYGPQKGLSAYGVKRGEKRLFEWASAWPGGLKAASLPGAGAGGGLAFGLYMGLGGRLVPGAALVAEVIQLRERLSRADLVITGEGSYDEQSEYGKATGFLVGQARRMRKTVVIVAGTFAREETPREISTLFRGKAFSAGWDQGDFDARATPEDAAPEGDANLVRIALTEVAGPKTIEQSMAQGLDLIVDSVQDLSGKIYSAGSG